MTRRPLTLHTQQCMEKVRSMRLEALEASWPTPGCPACERNRKGQVDRSTPWDAVSANLKYIELCQNQKHAAPGVPRKDCDECNDELCTNPKHEQYQLLHADCGECRAERVMAETIGREMAETLIDEIDARGGLDGMTPEERVAEIERVNQEIAANRREQKRADDAAAHEAFHRTSPPTQRRRAEIEVDIENRLHPRTPMSHLQMEVLLDIRGLLGSILSFAADPRHVVLNKHVTMRVGSARSCAGPEEKS